MRDTPVSQIMNREVLTFHVGDRLEDAIRSLVEWNVGGAPVVDDDGRLVGVLEDDDIIVADARLHMPTVINILGASIELPGQHKHFEDDLKKALASTVADVMDDDPPTCTEDDTVEQVATVMHERDVQRVPVVRDGKVVGIVGRGDVLRSMIS